MFLLAYLAAAWIVWAVLLFVSMAARSRIARFSILSAAAALFFAILFYLVSWTAGLVSFGAAQTWSYPQDYLARGAVGILIMALPIAGVLSPIIAAWLVRRKAAAVL